VTAQIGLCHPGGITVPGMTRRIRRARPQPLLPEGFRDPAQHLYAERGRMLIEYCAQRRLVLAWPEASFENDRPRHFQVRLRQREEHCKAGITQTSRLVRIARPQDI